MWIKRKPKNRRFERQHILDVKVQSRQLRSFRLRLAAKIFSRLFAVATAAFLLWQGTDWFLQEFVFRNPAFAIQSILVETDGILPTALLRHCAGAKIGDNLLALDLNRIQRDLEYLPWVQSAAVERDRPHTLRIRVIEREPIAQTTLFEPTPAGTVKPLVFYLDEQGYVMLPLTGQQVDSSALGFDSLPMLTGLSSVDLRPGRRAESRQIQAALRLIAEFSHSPMLGLVDLTTIDLYQPAMLQISTGQGALVTFGVDNLEQQLRRWRLVHDYAARSGKAVASLDLSVSNNVPARWFEASSVVPARPKALKTSPYRKKHV
jgi:hypothetical protein